MTHEVQAAAHPRHRIARCHLFPGHLLPRRRVTSSRRADAAAGLTKPPLLDPRPRARVPRRARARQRARCGRGASARAEARTSRSCSSATTGAFVLRRPPRPPLPPSAHDVVREARLQLALREAGFDAAPDDRRGRRGREHPRRPVLRHDLPRGPSSRRTSCRPGSRSEPVAPRASATTSSTRWSRSTRRTSTTPGARRVRAPGELQRATGAALRAALGHQQDARAPAGRARSAAWLADNVPDPLPETVVHGDFRLGNTMVAPRRAVADRRGARLGDGRDRRSARGRRLSARDVQRAGRPAEPARDVAGHRAPGLPVQGGARRALRRRAAAATSSRSPGSRRSRSGRPPSSARRSTAASCAASSAPRTSARPASSRACRTSPTRPRKRSRAPDRQVSN